MGYKKKSETKRGRSQDRKLVALTSKHERQYLIKKAKQLIKLCEEDIKIVGARSKVYFWGVDDTNKFPVTTLKRLAKALIKCLKRYK